jgi:hypothetical protein
VKKKNAKMPYSKLNEYGIVFKGLPNNLEDEIGKTPRKPALYGSAQRRELWQCRNSWSFTSDTLSSKFHAIDPLASSLPSSINSDSPNSVVSLASIPCPSTSSSLVTPNIPFPCSSTSSSSQSSGIENAPTSVHDSSNHPIDSTITASFSVSAVTSSHLSPSVSNPAACNSTASDRSKMCNPRATLASLHDLHKAKAVKVPKGRAILATFTPIISTMEYHLSAKCFVYQKYRQCYLPTYQFCMGKAED